MPKYPDVVFAIMKVLRSQYFVMGGSTTRQDAEMIADALIEAGFITVDE